MAYQLERLISQTEIGITAATFVILPPKGDGRYYIHSISTKSTSAGTLDVYGAKQASTTNATLICSLGLSDSHVGFPAPLPVPPGQGVVVVPSAGTIRVTVVAELVQEK